MDPIFSAIEPGKPVYNGPELMVVPGYLNPAGCAALVAYAAKTAGKPAPVGDTTNESQVGNRQDAAFTADRIDIQGDPFIVEQSIAMCRDIYANGVARHFGVDIEWFEVPHLLRYYPGGNYLVHSDSENWDEQQQSWIKGVNRDYSSVLYLNDDFTGGTLAFPALNLRVQPRPGLLVTFPSDHRFRHAAEETLSGQRYVFVTWAAAVNTEKLTHGMPPHIVRLSPESA